MAQLPAHSASARRRVWPLRARGVAHRAMPVARQAKWTMLRVQRATHARVAVYADRLGCPMAQVIEDAVDVYGRLQEKGLRMHEKLTFYVIYVDAKPLYIVGAVSADAAVQGFRENLLGKVQFTQLQA